MEVEAAKKLAAILNRRSAGMDEFIELIKKEVPQPEQASILKAIGEIFAIEHDQIQTRLIRLCPNIKSEFE